MGRVSSAVIFWYGVCLDVSIMQDFDDGHILLSSPKSFFSVIFTASADNPSQFLYCSLGERACLLELDRLSSSLPLR